MSMELTRRVPPTGEPGVRSPENRAAKPSGAASSRPMPQAPLEPRRSTPQRLVRDALNAVGENPAAVKGVGAAMLLALGGLSLKNAVEQGGQDFADRSGRAVVRPDSFDFTRMAWLQANRSGAADDVQVVADRLQRRSGLPASALLAGLERLGPEALLAKAEDPGLPAALGVAVLLEALPPAQRSDPSMAPLAKALASYERDTSPPLAWALALADLMNRDLPQSMADLAQPLMAAVLPHAGATPAWNEQAAEQGSRALAADFRRELGARLLPGVAPEQQDGLLRSLSSLGQLRAVAPPADRHVLRLLELAAWTAAGADDPAASDPDTLALLHHTLAALRDDTAAGSRRLDSGGAHDLLLEVVDQASVPVLAALASGEIAEPTLPPGASEQDITDRQAALYRKLVLNSPDTVTRLQDPHRRTDLRADLLEVLNQPGPVVDVGGPLTQLPRVVGAASAVWRNLEAALFLEQPSQPSQPNQASRPPSPAVPAPTAPEASVMPRAVPPDEPEEDHPDWSQFLAERFVSGEEPLPPKTPRHHP